MKPLLTVLAHAFPRTGSPPGAICLSLEARNYTVTIL